MAMKDKIKQKKESSDHTGVEAWIRTLIHFWQSMTNVRKQKNFKHETINPLIPLPQCSEPKERIQMNLFGPLKTSENGKNSSCASLMLFQNLQNSLLFPTNVLRQ
jgi:hypothetical protein